MALWYHEKKIYAKDICRTGREGGKHTHMGG